MKKHSFVLGIFYYLFLVVLVYLLWVLQWNWGIGDIFKSNIYVGNGRVLFVVFKLLQMLTGVLLGLPQIIGFLSQMKELGLKVQIRYGAWFASASLGFVLFLHTLGIITKFITLEKMGMEAPRLFMGLKFTMHHFFFGFCSIAAGYLALPRFRVSREENRE